MKFNIDDVTSYDGSDLIFLIGTPGSRWSNIHRILSENPAINTTDWSEEKSWGDDVYGLDLHGKVNNMGIHKGSYWGPGNMYGQNFDRLDKLSKKEIISEFMNAYETWDKIKIIKSHWFAYNISYLHYLFPKAKIVFCYAGDLESFYWWHKCGGWGLGYANYSWYKDDVRLFQKIKEENSNILKFCIDRDLDFRTIQRNILYEKLGIPHESERNPSTKCKVAVYSGEYVSNYSHLDSSGR